MIRTLSDARPSLMPRSFEVGADGTWLRISNDHGQYIHRIEVRDQSSDAPAGELRPAGHRPVSPDGAWRVTIHDNEVRLWDPIRDRPGPVTRVDPGQYSQFRGAIWLAADSFVVYGHFGLQHYDVVAGPHASEAA